MKDWRDVMRLWWLILLCFGATPIDSSSTNRGSTRKKGKEEFPSCGGCYCIPDDLTKFSCPTEHEPQVEFDYIDVLRRFKYVNPLIVVRDPYKTNNPRTDCCSAPVVEGSACIAEFQVSTPEDSLLCPERWSYKLTTFTSGSFEDAVAHYANKTNAIVTHSGHCGACSSLRDLAAYMANGPRLLCRSTTCAAAGLLGERFGIRCYQKLGFTESCAKIWHYSGVETRKSCRGVCLKFTLANRDPNGPAPNCPLADCLECDELRSGPVFKIAVGRNRRNSGLRSGIVRFCSEIDARVRPKDPCDGSVVPNVIG